MTLQEVKIERIWHKNTTRYAMYQNGIEVLREYATKEPMNSFVRTIQQYEEGVNTVDEIIDEVYDNGSGDLFVNAGDYTYKLTIKHEIRIRI